MRFTLALWVAALFAMPAIAQQIISEYLTVVEGQPLIHVVIFDVP